MLGPIFNREFLTIPRRWRHYTLRLIYLAVLWLLAITAWNASFGWVRTRDVSLGDLAFFGVFLFQLLSLLQLTLVLFFSGLIAASAITQEKDRRTFILLLITDMSNAEIVLGKLFGSLLQIVALTACAAPVLAFTTLLGGVTLDQVVRAFVVLISSALAAGSLGCFLGVWREKTFQTLALTVLSLVMYVLLVEGFGALGGWLFPSLEGRAAAVAWMTRLNPFRAMLLVIDPMQEVGSGAALTYQFAGLMLLASAALNGLSVWKLRAWNPRGEPIQQRESLEAMIMAGRLSAGHAPLHSGGFPPQAKGKPAAAGIAAADEGKQRVNVHAAPGKARAVWPNPILWREMRTRGYGRRPLLVKAAYLLIVGLIVFWIYRGLAPESVADRMLPAWGLVPVTVLSLILLNAQAVTAVTSERDLKALELLLCSDLTPREFVFGKLWGIFWNAKEIVLPPLILSAAYAWWGFFGLEALAYLLLTQVVLMIFTATLGLHIALHHVNTRAAIGNSLGTIFFLFLGTLVCVYLIFISGRFEYQWLSFLGFLAAGGVGLYFVLAWYRWSLAIFWASIFCPLAAYYAVISILIGDPRTGASGDVLWPFLVLGSAFGFTVLAILVPLLSEFDVALDYTTPAEE